MSTTYEIGSNIRKIRKERGLTIADALETDANTILNVKKEVDLAEELGIILKSMSKEDGCKVINILLSIKEPIDGGDE